MNTWKISRPRDYCQQLGRFSGHRSSSARVGTSKNWACDRHHYLIFGQRSTGGFLSELQQAGLAPTWICNKHYNVESGREAAEEWLHLTDRPTAVFCSCDETAFGFIAALQRKGPGSSRCIRGWL